ncbi:hypothetical protein [Parvularcula lutaonensis]|uniref:DUF4064 domain-containing protein n=1 Tax=Parvularcula lutaonensis TaxID=491923 RepID=A0ABV7MGF5_9PROT|nr:hypothetical protein [Parvularcula lutaonensis]GGY54145.1 hypothetical protein GCM10007148_24600 [Parvularcula lutaonensis]
MTDKTDTDGDAPRARIAHGLGAAVGAFLVGTLGLAVTFYITGHAAIGETAVAVEELSFLELTNAAAFGVASTVVSLLMGLVGMVTAAGAAIIGLAVGAVGIAGALVVGLGVITGPLLLAGAIGILIKRRFFPDVI